MLRSSLLSMVCVAVALANVVGGCGRDPGSGDSDYHSVLDSVAKAGRVTGNTYSNYLLGVEFTAPDSMYLEVGDLDAIYHGATELIPDSSVRHEMALSTLFIFSSREWKMQARGKYQYMYRAIDVEDEEIERFLKEAKKNFPKGLAMAGAVVDDIRQFVQEVDGVPLNCIEVYATDPDFSMIYRMYAIPTTRGIMTFEILGQVYNYPARAAEILEGLDIISNAPSHPL